MAVRSWTATQSGSSVTGASVLEVNPTNPVSIQATMAGTVSGAQLTSVVFTVPAQNVLPAGCSFSGAGTLSAAASSVSGPLTITFATPCVGPNNVSPTPTQTWTFSLTK